MAGTRLDTILEGTRLDQIGYANKPPGLGGQINYLSATELEEKLKFSYNESILGNRSALNANFLTADFLDTFRIETKSSSEIGLDGLVLSRLKTPLKSLVIFNMDKEEKGEIGHGLTTSEDIACGTVICIYAGVVAAKSDQIDKTYCCIWGETRTGGGKLIDGRAIGGLARFMPHLPYEKSSHVDYLKNKFTRCPSIVSSLNKIGESVDSRVKKLVSDSKEEASELQFHDARMRNALATANVTIEQVLVQGVPVTALVAMRDIKKFEPIGFSYGPEYWHGITKRYFTKQGKMIEPTAYTHTSTTNHHAKRVDDRVSYKALIGPQNALVLSQDGQIALVSQQYRVAKARLEQALALFQKQNAESTPACGHCHAALSQCYSAMNLKEDSRTNLQKAIAILHGHEEHQEQLTFLITQYETEFLAKENTQQLYNSALALYQAKQYIVASYTLHYLTRVFKKDEEKEVCYSTLASCYRDMKEYSKALDACNAALTLGMQSTDRYKKNLEKLKGIKELAAACTPEKTAAKRGLS